MELQPIIRNIYVHIPFCRSRCPYCDFFSVKFDKNYPLKSLILKEISMDKEKWDLSNIKNIYFGGGTPSIYNADFYRDILDLIGNNISEVSIEINPEDGKHIDFKALKDAGVTRISLGIQTFQERSLNLLGRNYNKNDIIDTIEKISNDFGNFSYDRLIGIPFDSERVLKEDLDLFLRSKPPHISLYILTLNSTQKNIIKNRPDDNLVARLYKKASEILQDNEYEHYEISNFAKEKKYCNYNIDVWNCKDYIGIGPGAVGTIENKRYFNFSSLKRYEQQLNANELPIEKIEELNEKEQKFENLMLGMRTKWGVNIKKIRKFLNMKKVNKFYKEGYLNIENGNLKLTENGFLFYNSIVTEVGG